MGIDGTSMGIDGRRWKSMQDLMNLDERASMLIDALWMLHRCSSMLIDAHRCSPMLTDAPRPAPAAQGKADSSDEDDSDADDDEYMDDE